MPFPCFALQAASVIETRWFAVRATQAYPVGCGVDLFSELSKLADELAF